MAANKELTPLEQAFYLLSKAESKIKKLVKARSEPIAIVGMGCRFPGGANDPETYWKLLSQGYNAISEVPKERWNIEDYYDPNPDAPGKMYIRSAGFLTVPVDQFDPQFFGIAPREVEFMDPQQRLLLEVTWEALENAAINPKELNGSATGVFIGATTHDYHDLLSRYETESEIDTYQMIGNLASALPGRVSFTLGLQGPSFPVDTACSSSLVALHEACQSLRREETNLAIAGGVNLILSPNMVISMCKAHMLSKDGHCKTFDASADGYGRGEGCGVVILKRLSDAERDGDHILAIVKGTGVNQDGASSGLTVPNGEAQENLLRNVWAQADIEPGQIDFIEAHGTGTSLGDPIEVNAIQSAIKGTRQTPLILSSVKSNIGHLESAAGIAGLIKIVLSLNHEAIPPVRPVSKLNPHLRLDEIQIPSDMTTWKRGNKPRLAGISSFGISGTNSHAILQEAPAVSKAISPTERPLHIMTLSAKSEKALQDLVAKYIPLPDGAWTDIAFTANVGRADLPYRLTLIAATKEEAEAKLRKGDYKIAKKSEIPPKTDYDVQDPKTDWKEHLETLSTLYLQGIPIDWKAFDKPFARVKVALPTYPFERSRFWARALDQKPARATVDKFYQLAWEPQSIQPKENPSLNGSWIVFIDKEPHAQQFVEKVQSSGGECILNPQDLVEFLNQPISGIVYFLSDSLQLVQALAKLLELGTSLPPIWFVTSGAQIVLDEPVDLNAAPLVGILRTLNHEHPNMKYRHIDFDMEAGIEIDHLRQEILQDSAEKQIAWRKGKRLIARLLPVKPEAFGAFKELNPEASYLITGGLGSLGLIMAEYLADQGAKHLVLIGRHAPQEAVLERLDRLRQGGVSVEHRSIDIANAQAVEELLKDTQNLKGIIHAAGVAENAVLRNQSWQKFLNVFGPKVTGSWNLHEKTEKLGIKLDFLVFFSSMSSIFGIPGQSNYSAANAYMDALAHFRRQKGLPALSINWGAWEEEGMATKVSSSNLQKRRFPGILPLKTSQALESFKKALSYQGSQLMIVPMDAKELVNLPDSWKGLLEKLLPATPTPSRLEIKQVSSYLREKLRHILAFESSREIEGKKGFFDLGMDSLMALELKNQLQTDLGTAYKLPETLAFDYPNLDQLTKYFEQLLGKEMKETISQVRAVNKTEPLAIIGLSCRFPGGANDPESFWKLLSEGKDGISQIPPDRWDVDAYYSPEPDQPGKIITRKGGFLNNIDQFDADFFGITRREAESLDPQQRLALETTWEALERSGYAPSTLNGSLTGVFIGVSISEYLTNIIKQSPLKRWTPILRVATFSMVSQVVYPIFSAYMAPPWQ